MAKKIAALKIDKESYKASDVSYYNEIYNKKQIILGSTLRKDSHYLTHLSYKDLGKTKSYNTYTITRDGIIYEHFDPKYYSDYIDVKEIDKYSISILFENMNVLLKTDNKFHNLIGEECERDCVAKKLWNGFNYWEIYTDKQIDSGMKLIKKLCKEHNIKQNTIGFNSFNKDAIKYQGIVSKSNLFENYLDVNPSFDFLKLQYSFEL